MIAIISILHPPLPALLTDPGLRVKLQIWVYLANITQSHWGVSAPCSHVILMWEYRTQTSKLAFHDLSELVHSISMLHL